MAKEIGPQLPPYLSKGKNAEDIVRSEVITGIGPRFPCRKESADEDDNCELTEIGPSLPPRHLESAVNKDDSCEIPGIGPQLPPHLKNLAKSEDGSCKSAAVCPQLHSHDSVNPAGEMTGIGPQLPAHFCSSSDASNNSFDKRQEASVRNNLYGPALPPGYSKNDDPASVIKSVTIGPQLPSNLTSINPCENDNYSDDNVIGPCLPIENVYQTGSKSVKDEFEARAKAMKDKLTGSTAEEKVIQRESWMTELPPEIGKNFGLGPRTFRTKEQDLGDRSVWTDTPADRERKRREVREEQPAKKKRVPTADELEMHSCVEEYNQVKRPQSLLEMHRSKQEGQKTTARQPFDRERDLAVHRSDPKQTAKFIEGAKNMNEKFSAGSYENSFL